VFARSPNLRITEDMNHENPSEVMASRVQALTNEMLSFCGPIFITPGLLTYPEQMTDSGTYSLIDTGNRRVLVTCHHVWEAYLTERGTNPHAALGLNLGEGEASIAFACPEKQLIDCDSGLDLAVFEFEPAHLSVNGTKVSHEKDWFPIREWPPRPARDGDYVALMGFSGKQIKKEGRLCTFVTQALPFGVSGVGLKDIWIFNEDENAEVFGDVRQWLGGLSGSPAYTFDEDGANLVGFVRSGYKSDTPEQANGDSIFAGTLILTPSTFLQADGSLRRP
jgi:hypothetical protein